MARTAYINDTHYGPKEVLEHRELIIQLRDEALKQNDFQWSVTLSITVALLHRLAVELEENRNG